LGSHNSVVTALGSCVKWPLLFGETTYTRCKSVRNTWMRWSKNVNLNATSSHTRLRAHDHYTSSTLIGGKGGAGPSSLPTTLEGTNGVYKWMQDGCKVYMDSYMVSNGSCFLVTQTISQNHLSEVDLTQNRATTTLWTLTFTNPKP